MPDYSDGYIMLLSKGIEHVMWGLATAQVHPKPRTLQAVIVAHCISCFQLNLLPALGPGM